MMALERVRLAEPGNLRVHRFRRGFSIVGLGFAVLFAAGMIISALVRHGEEGGAVDLRLVLILGALALVMAGCIWLLTRTLQAPPTGEDPLTAKERLNRNILIGCGALGGVMGLTMAAVEPRQLAGGDGILSDGPLPASFALVMALVTGILVPAISIYWHRHATDEVEADAYKVGALYGLSVYMIGAPVWWFLWRGGLAPAPNGIVIYMITIATVGVIWTWKKYR